jgi:hypothetical protein
MEGRAQANTTHRSFLPPFTGKRKENKSGYFIATPRVEEKKILRELLTGK